MKKAISVICLLVGFLLCCPNLSEGQVFWDSSFNNTGTTSRMYYTSTSTTAYRHILLNNGKLRSLGTGFSTYNGYIYGHKADGSYDNTIGSSAVYETGSSGNLVAITSIPGDTIFAIGKTTDLSGNEIMTVLEMDSNCNPISSFGSGGMIKFPILYSGVNYGCTPQAIAVQNDGKIIVAANANLLFPIAQIKRFKRNGGIDSSFGVNGTVELHVSSCGYRPKQIFPLSSGKIIVTGDYLSTSSTEYFSALKFKNNGEFDSSFATNGIAADYVNFDGSVNASFIQADGKIVIGGTGIIRYTANGAVDTSFATGGIYYAYYSPVTIDAMGVDSRGDIYLLGCSTNISLARLHSNGTLDNSFNGSGYFNYSFSGANAYRTRSMTVYPNGKVLMYGDYRDASYLYHIFHARIYAHPSIEIKGNGKLQYCEGDSAILYCHTNAGIHWYKGTSLLSDTTKQVKVGATGSYTAVTHWGSNSDTAFSVDLVFNALPSPTTLTVDSDSISCAATGVSYAWYKMPGDSLVFTSTIPSFHPTKKADYYVIVTNASGCKAKSATISYTPPPSYVITLQEGKDGIEVFPNPVSDVLQIQNNLPATVAGEITDIQGRTILKLTLHNGLNSYNLLNGGIVRGQVLILRVYGDHGGFIRKINFVGNR